MIKYLETIVNILFTNQYTKILLAIIAGLGIFMGINLTHDSFAYMEGANNILNGRGLVVNCNLLSASAFQPLYSYLMIPFIYILGYSAKAIITFHFFLFLVTYFIYDRLLSNGSNGINPIVKYFSIIILIYPYFTILLSESLLIALLGLYLNILFYFKGRQVFKFSLIIFLLAAIFLTKNSALLIIIPIHLSLIEFKKENWFRYYFKNAVILGTIVVTFLIIKILLGSVDSHPFVFGGGLYPIKTYLIQILRDMSVWIFGRSVMHFLSDSGYGIYFNLISILIIIFIFVKSEINSKSKYLLFLLYATLIHLFVFSNVAIDSELDGRFLFWFNFVFIFVLISETHKQKFFKVLFAFIVVINCANITYSRYKTFKPYNLKDVVMKFNYNLDSKPFFTDKIRYPSLIYDNKTLKYIIQSPAYPSMIDN